MKILNQLPQEQPASAAEDPKRIGPAELDPVDVAMLRSRLEEELGSEGGADKVWRSLEELSGDPDFDELVQREFPRYAPQDWQDGVSRRGFVQLAGASLGLAGLTACTRQPRERIVPYVEQPENLVPGKPLFYATAMAIAGYGIGVIAESQMGRPTKLGGNPGHPWTEGATGVFIQGETLNLYDPDRAQSLTRGDRILPWDAFSAELTPTLQAIESLGGAGLALMTPAITSPTTKAQIDAVRQRFPEVRWVQYEPVHRDAFYEGSKIAFGEPLEVRYDFTKADIVLSLDSDFLAAGPGALRYARDFSARRRIVEGAEMNRLYVVESTPTETGSAADHRAPGSSAEIADFAKAVAAKLGVPGVVAGEPHGELASWVDAVASDLQAHGGSSVVIAGESAEPGLQALAHAMNGALGNLGETVTGTDPVVAELSMQGEDLAQLVREMRDGKIAALFALDCNPVYDAPADLDFASALERVALKVQVGMYQDETADKCDWQVAKSHALEAWGDVRSMDGTLSIVQPLIEPLYQTRTIDEVLSLVAGRPSSDYDLVRATWQGELGDSFEDAWRKTLHDGFLEGSAEAVKSLIVDDTAVSEESKAIGGHGEGLELQLMPDGGVFDGRFANNGWLMELPRSINKITWDNAAIIAPSTAEEAGFKTNDVVSVSMGDHSIDLPVWVQPGQAAGTVTVHLGFGRERAGRVGNGVGANAYHLRDSKHPWRHHGVELARTGRQRKLATTQTHFNLDQQDEQASRRHLIRHGTLEKYKKDPHFVEHMGHHVPEDSSMFKDWEYTSYKWGMVVDLSSCTGCNACIISCQAENNIPVVGYEQVLNGREMHWLRIDRYYNGDLDNPKIHHQPVSCMQCERAPCELVCPVGATVHDEEGINTMVYNRCIGTRYCSNNCPYKVRRFNFLKYNDTKTPVLKLARNPNVSVRMRGVMEKCTYCIQRINYARIEAKKEDRRIRDGEVRTACEEACPADCVAFGDLNDPESRVSQWRAHDTNYELLHELNVAPRTTYLAKITNPNPALVGDAEQDHGAH
ncbi:MAG: TAT-variant-translocated molybdopterin oxidoreductase [Acidobacteriota bacterium]